MPEQIFGLYELDAAGTILYSLPHNGARPQPSMVGSNFFEEIDAIENAERLRSGIKSFIRSNRSVGSFTFESGFHDGGIKAKVLLTRGHETQNDSVAGIVIMDIKRNEDF